MSAHRKTAVESGYEQDFYAWTGQQAALLRAGRLSELDAANLAEEIESLGRTERHELVSRLSILLLHLLKWSHQPERQGKSWSLTIVEGREQIVRHLLANPSLEHRQDEAVAQAYKAATIRAERETGLLRDMFPWACPFSIGQILDDAFWPTAE